MADENEIEIDETGGNQFVEGNMKVDGNLEVGGQISTNDLNVVDENLLSIMSTSGEYISFKKSCDFKDSVQFCGGRTMIGKETTYNSAYVGTETLQAGKRIVVGDSLMKIDSATRKIIADTFKMTLSQLDVDKLTTKKETANLIEANTVKISNELIGKTIFADEIKTNNLFIENLGSRSLRSTENMTTQDLIVNGSAEVNNYVTINGDGVGPNGAALTVIGGSIVARKGILSNTRNNRFQTMQITGGENEHDICFRVDPDVDSLFEGNVTVKDSNLILDNSKIVTDNLVVTSVDQITEDGTTMGVQLSTKNDWETYKDSTVEDIAPSQANCEGDSYDPVAEVQAAIERNQTNYENIHAAVKSIINPITYLMEQCDPSVPKKFNVKDGVYRIDHMGNAMLRNLVSEKGRFSQLDAYEFNVNQLHVDKIVTTGVASDVVQSDNLLKSEGIAEFDGSVNIKADVFLEEESRVHVADGAGMVFHDGASLVMQNGAKMEMGSSTTVKMSGDVQLDLSKLVFFDSRTGRKYRISFRDAHCGEGEGIVMDYERVPETSSMSSSGIAQQTRLDSRELDKKLKSLGI